MDKDNNSADDHFWHADSTSMYAKVMWKDPLSGVGMDPPLFSYGVEDLVVFLIIKLTLQDGYQKDW